MSDRIDYFLKERSNVYVPNHKQWVQLFKRCPENDEKGFREIEGESVEVIVRYAYFMRQIEYMDEWEKETEIIEEEEVLLTAEQYLEKHFDIIWGM